MVRGPLHATPLSSGSPFPTTRRHASLRLAALSPRTTSRVATGRPPGAPYVSSSRQRPISRADELSFAVSWPRAHADWSRCGSRPVETSPISSSCGSATQTETACSCCPHSRATPFSVSATHPCFAAASHLRGVCWFPERLQSVPSRGATILTTFWKTPNCAGSTRPTPDNRPRSSPSRVRHGRVLSCT